MQCGLACSSVRALRAPPALPAMPRASLFWPMAQDPISASSRTSVPSPLMPQQGQAPGPHSPAQLWAPLSWASLWTQVPVWPHPQGGARCLGLPLVPPSLPWLPGPALLPAWGSASSHCVLQSDRDLLAQRVCSDCPMSPTPTHAGLAQTRAGAINHMLCAMEVPLW